MSGFWSMRRLMTGTILAVVVAGATCLWAQTGPAAGPAIPAGGAMPDPDKAIAVIDGRPINNKAFYDILMQEAGMKVFQQVFDLTLVQKACLNAGIALDGKEFKDRLTDEYNRTLQSLAITFEMPTSWPATTKSVADQKKDYETMAREQALNYVLQRQGVTAVEFRIGLETRANLRALAQILGRITVTPQECTDAYDSKFGEKRAVHIFLLNDKEPEKKLTAADIRPVLEANAKLPESERKSLEDLANSKKWPQPNSWTISFNAKGVGVDEVRKVAFGMKLGEISAATKVPQGDKPDQNVLIVLDKIIADTKKEHPYKESEMKTEVQEYKESQWSNTYLNNLRANAAVQINDPILQEQFKAADAARRQQEAAAAAAATQSTGTAPSTPTPTPTVTPLTPAPRGATAPTRP